MSMSGEHVTPPANPLEAMVAIARQDDAAMHHLRACPRCRLAWHRVGAFRAGCTDPRLGAVVLSSIGHPRLPEVARDHMAGCLACRLLVLDATRAMAAGPAGV
jgi:hypothetical protein